MKELYHLCLFKIEVIYALLINNNFSHVAQFIELVFHRKKVKECLHSIWMGCLWIIWKQQNQVIFI